MPGAFALPWVTMAKKRFVPQPFFWLGRRWWSCDGWRGRDKKENSCRRRFGMIKYRIVFEIRGASMGAVVIFSRANQFRCELIQKQKFSRTFFWPIFDFLSMIFWSRTKSAIFTAYCFGNYSEFSNVFSMLIRLTWYFPILLYSSEFNNQLQRYLIMTVLFMLHCYGISFVSVIDCCGAYQRFDKEFTESIVCTSFFLRLKLFGSSNVLAFMRIVLGRWVKIVRISLSDSIR